MAESIQRSYTSFSNFVETVKSVGLTRTNRFEVLIVPPRGLMGNQLIKVTETALLANATSLPPMEVSTGRLKIYGPTFPRPTGISYGDTITVSFIVDAGMSVRNLFEEWIHAIVNRDSYNVSYAVDYTSEQIIITKLDESDNRIYEYTLVGAFPVKISESPLQFSETGFVTMDVTFAYRSWTGTQYAAGFGPHGAADLISTPPTTNNVVQKSTNLPILTMPETDGFYNAY